MAIGDRALQRVLEVAQMPRRCDHCRWFTKETAVWRCRVESSAYCLLNPPAAQPDGDTSGFPIVHAADRCSHWSPKK